MSSIEIDDFRAEHIDELIRMWRASFEHGVGIIDPHPLEQQTEHFRREVLPRNRVRIAHAAGRIVGFVAANCESISQIFVRVDHLRQGIGTMLLNLAKAESHGSLWLYTFARNAGACAFYESQGFVVVQRGFEPFWQLEDVKYLWTRQQDRGRPRTGSRPSDRER